MNHSGTIIGSKPAKLALLGSGELGKEIAIEAQRLGIYVVAIDRYPVAPAMQVANEFRVIDMLNGPELEKSLREIQPDFIIPELEAIHTETLVSMEANGFKIVPSAKAVHLTMNREGIRNFASKELGLKTSKYFFADTFEEFRSAIESIGFPCVVKPIMSSSGKGQSLIQSDNDIELAWDYGQKGGRAGKGKMIIEEFIQFDYEITLLTIQHVDGVTFLQPIGHKQVNGDYVESWMPQPMSDLALTRAREIANKVTSGLGGFGIFGVELFIKGDEVFFSEVSPRPHDTGLVTLISQNFSEFSLHLRALLGLTIPEIIYHTPAASAAILLEAKTDSPKIGGLAESLTDVQTDIRIFGKPTIDGKRRMGVALARSSTIEDARQRARLTASKLHLL
ncbi:formate-dependent phosphoribosylglycinamide formyltransferase [Leptospira sp. GIMC2001]|uniref:formate-dependent phosphoribosylglycinamide formyltransferase n=1 Tax=Leptospira sp. GIMC2001 TaxID=1513297 RepID=UPI00234A94A9|nr:formate-dependent phosphoribosylglycinamide formyltransferase [Leptospira sp. GIMC2001]WCL50134.1 formate-dependent phosphoribosylglycinamide formyltransferase [Leptospira sp. GIMC2001]